MSLFYNSVLIFDSSAYVQQSSNPEVQQLHRGHAFLSVPYLRVDVESVYKVPTAASSRIRLPPAFLSSYLP